MFSLQFPPILEDELKHRQNSTRHTKEFGPISYLEENSQLYLQVLSLFLERQLLTFALALEQMSAEGIPVWQHLCCHCVN